MCWVLGDLRILKSFLCLGIVGLQFLVVVEDNVMGRPHILAEVAFSDLGFPAAMLPSPTLRRQPVQAAVAVPVSSFGEAAAIALALCRPFRSLVHNFAGVSFIPELENDEDSESDCAGQLAELRLQDCTSSFPNDFKDCEAIIVIAVSRHQIC
jgi:hypothetical protein